jgi:hypothetical protein
VNEESNSLDIFHFELFDNADPMTSNSIFETIRTNTLKKVPEILFYDGKKQLQRLNTRDAGHLSFRRRIQGFAKALHEFPRLAQQICHPECEISDTSFVGND